MWARTPHPDTLCLAGLGWELEHCQQTPVQWAHSAGGGLQVEMGELWARGLKGGGLAPVGGWLWGVDRIGAGPYSVA